MLAMEKNVIGRLQSRAGLFCELLSAGLISNRPFNTNDAVFFLFPRHTEGPGALHPDSLDKNRLTGLSPCRLTDCRKFLEHLVMSRSMNSHGRQNRTLCFEANDVPLAKDIV